MARRKQKQKVVWESRREELARLIGEQKSDQWQDKVGLKKRFPSNTVFKPSGRKR